MKLLPVSMIALSLCLSSCDSSKKGTDEARLRQLENLPMSNAELSSAVDAMGLLKANDTQSRENLAKALEVQLNDLIVTEAKEAQLMREIALYSIKALRVGGDKLCSEEDKITLYRGHSQAHLTKTSTGTNLIPARGILKSPSNIMNTLRTYAQETQESDRAPAFQEVNPFSYFDLSQRHTVAISLDKSPFISLSHSAATASSFGDTLITVKICPGRAPSTGSQAWQEQEMLAFLFLLPEEISKVTNPAPDFPEDVSALNKCYAPEIGGGPRNIAKFVDQATFDDYNASIEEKLKKERTTSKDQEWGKFIKTFTAQRCGCEKLALEKDKLWKKLNGDANPSPFGVFECESH
jgi:hypothetical protein